MTSDPNFGGSPFLQIDNTSWLREIDAARQQGNLDIESGIYVDEKERERAAVMIVRLKQRSASQRQTIIEEAFGGDEQLRETLARIAEATDTGEQRRILRLLPTAQKVGVTLFTRERITEQMRHAKVT